jgi:hypothetical protein
MTAADKSRMEPQGVLLSISPMPSGFHPGEPSLVMSQYRRYILSSKKRWSTARGLIHYKQFIQSYLWAKRLVIARRAAQPQSGSLDV